MKPNNKVQLEWIAQHKFQTSMIDMIDESIHQVYDRISTERLKRLRPGGIGRKIFFSINHNLNFTEFLKHHGNDDKINYIVKIYFGGESFNKQFGIDAEIMAPKIPKMLKKQLSRRGFKVFCGWDCEGPFFVEFMFIEVYDAPFRLFDNLSLQSAA